MQQIHGVLKASLNESLFMFTLVHTDHACIDYHTSDRTLIWRTSWAARAGDMQEHHACLLEL